MIAGLRLIPRWVWIALAVAILYRGALSWHHRQVKALHDAAYAEGGNAERARLEAEAKRLKAETDAKTAAIARLTKEKHDAEVRAIAADADALRLSGAGKASLGARCPVMAGGSSGHDLAGSGTENAGSEVPATDGLAVVPWGWVVGTGESHDSLRSEVLAWRDWYARNGAAWPK